MQIYNNTVNVGITNIILYLHSQSHTYFRNRVMVKVKLFTSLTIVPLNTLKLAIVGKYLKNNCKRNVGCKTFSVQKTIHEFT